MKDEPWRGSMEKRLQHLEGKLANKKRRITELEAEVEHTKNLLMRAKNSAKGFMKDAKTLRQKTQPGIDIHLLSEMQRFRDALYSIHDCCCPDCGSFAIADKALS